MMNYLITGATGLIGSMLIKKLISSDAYGSGSVNIIATARNEAKFNKVFEGYDCSNVRFLEHDLCEPMAVKDIPEPVDYIIHCAAATTSSYMVSNPVETADGIVLGTRNVLELARELNVKSMVYLSSMEVYGSVEDIGRMRGEDELGEVCLDSVRSCYPLGKRMAEHYCYIYNKEYGVQVKVARLAQTFGKGVRLDDNRVYMQFAKAVRNNEDIVLKTMGDSMGNYCATEDAVNAIFAILDRGADGEVYNVVNEANTMSIRSMAELVAGKVADGRIKVRIELEDLAKIGYAPKTGLRLSGEKLRKLGWYPTKDLEQMYKDILEELR